MSNIHELFTNWGKAQRQNPPQNEILKSEMLQRLNRLPELSGSTAQRRIPWFSLALAGLAVLALFVKQSTQELPGTTLVKEAADTISLAPQQLEYRIPPPFKDKVPITDDREFMKIRYHADISTRRVNELGKTIQTIVHGYDGRIDSLSTNENYGSIAFAVPADRFDDFREEIASLAPDRFIMENFSAQNLLPRKRILEQQKISDTQLLDDIATVHGTITLRWISVWDALDLYFGGYWLPLILGIAAVVAFAMNQRKKIVLPI